MKKFWLTCASVIMMVVGLIRGMDGINICIDGENVDLGTKIAASPEALTFVGICLIIVAILLIVAAIGLTLRRVIGMYVFSWISLGLFLVSGFINDFILFGYPFSIPQLIDWGITIAVALFLILGRESIRPKFIQSYEE